MKTRTLLLTLVPLASALFACAGEQETREPTYLGKEYAAFRQSLRECTARTGYDPERRQALGPYDLGAGELQWRDCAYGALMSIVVINTAYPDSYLALINKDRELTTGIVEKRVTREQRDAEIADQRQKIIERENSHEKMSAAVTEMEERKRLDTIVTSTHVLINNVQRQAR